MPVRAILFLLVGLLLLPVASQFLLTGVQRLTSRRTVSRGSAFFLLVLGAVLPELVLGIFCTYSHHPQLILSSVIASSALNVLVVLPFLAFSSPVVFEARRGEIRNVIFLLIVALLFLLLTSDIVLQGAAVDVLSRGDGLILLLMFPLLYFLQTSTTPNETEEAAEAEKSPSSKKRAVLLLLLGLVFIPIAGGAAVMGAEDLIYLYSMPADKVGILAIAIITALPEITMALQSRRFPELRSRLHNDLVLSSVLNIVLVLGVVALFGTVAAYEYMTTDSLFLVLSAFALLLFIVIGRGWKIERHEGIIMMFVYLCFFAYVLYREDIMHLF